MSKKLKVIRKNLKQYIKNGYFKARFKYTKYYDTLPINENEVLVQSFDGTSISCSPYYLLKELCENKEYSNLKKIIVARQNSVDSIKQIINEHNWKNVEIVFLHSKKYCYKLASSKYLINNSTFPPYFIKKQGQVYLNTWHGVPLKTLGRNIKSAPNELGNTQRNFMMADYLLWPNKFTLDAMRTDYMLNNLYKGKYILEGYPRNTAFFDDKKREEIKQKYELENKKIIVYMPTWRGTLETKNTEEQIVYTNHALLEMENNLDDNTVVFVKLHNYVKETLNFEKFTKIKPFPTEYETYEFLNIADCLLTDYSSVFWDFAITGKKIVLYAYDLDKYLSERGMYMDIKKLPFSLVTNTESLIKELQNLDDYKKYDNEIQDMMKYTNKDASKKICEYIFQSKTDNGLEIIDGQKYDNGKKNILMYSGALKKNGITSAFRNLINTIDNTQYNYIINFYKKAVNPNKEYINYFSNYDYMVIQGPKDMTLGEAICHFLYFKCNVKSKNIEKKLSKTYDRELKRIYPNMKFEYAINFSGYESQIMHLFEHLNTKVIIWAHNNMYKEEKLKGNFHKDSLKNAYKTSKNIVVVRETMAKELESYVDEKEKIKVVHNINDIDFIKQEAIKQIEFQDDTVCNVEIQKLNEILNDSSYCKFINIARFSKEKGLDRLIEAFQTFQKTNPKAYLIIIGGYGNEYENLINMVKEEDNIIIIKSILNPYPILSKCDVFVLSSIYEGLPMTIMEALILGKPVISTNITGPKEFLEQGYGYLVENSTAGVLQGMEDFKNGKLKSLKKFDAVEFNKKALQEFEELID